jgi:hypothetical protein
VLIAVFAVICYERAHRTALRGHGSMRKLVTFKAIVIVVTLENTIFTFCSAHFIWRPTEHVSYRDLQVGVPNTLICLEMFLMAIASLWSFTPGPYRRLERNEVNIPRSFGALRATANVFNVLDINCGCFWAAALCLPARHRNKVSRHLLQGADRQEVTEVSHVSAVGAHGKEES